MQDFLQHLLNGFSLGSIYALIALGYTMVYGILQMINFAHSEVYMVGAFASYYFARKLGIDNTPQLSTLLLLLFVSMLSCALLGFLIERIAYRPLRLRRSPKLNILITAIGVSLTLQYAGQVIFGADPKVFPNVMNDIEVFTFAGLSFKSLDLTIWIVSFVAMLGLHFLVWHTRTGRAMRAVSHSSSLAALMGINPDRVYSATFILGSMLAGIGSVLVGMKYPKIEPLMGTLFGIKAFVAAVLGGIGHIPGAVLGGLMMGLLEEMVVAYMSSTYRDALAFGLLIFVLIFKPAGLLGKRSIEKV